MSDIAMCNGDGCVDKETCLRFKSKPSDIQQYYGDFKPVKGGKCEYYLGTCKYIKIEGGSCSLNNKCRFPNCSDSQRSILKKLEDIVNGKA